MGVTKTQELGTFSLKLHNILLNGLLNLILLRVTCSYHILLEEEDDPKPNIKEDPESISNSQTQQDRMNMISLDSNDRIGSFEIKNDL